MTTEEVESLKKRLTDTYEADKAAIDRVLTLLGQNTEAKKPEPQSDLTVENRVLGAILALPPQFTLSEVMEKIAVLFPGEINRATVSSVLFRLKGVGKITLIKPGIGRRAAIYGKL